MKKVAIVAGTVAIIAGVSSVLQKYTNEKVSKLDYSTGSPEMYYDMETHEYYYYQLTSDIDKENYRKLQEAITNQDTNVKLKAVKTFDKIKTLTWFVLNDHPELFWFDNCKSTVFITGNASVNLTYTMTKEEIEQAKDDIDTFLMDVKATCIKRSMTDYEKEVAIYNYISEHARFDSGVAIGERSDYTQSIWSVVQGKTVCRGFSLMFKYICNKYNIPCIVVTGATGKDLEVNNKTINHGWNEVMIDGDWYIADLTDSRRSVRDQRFGTTFYQFNITTDTLLNYASINTTAIVPECTSTKYDYYKMSNTYFEEADIEKFNQLVEERNKSNDKRTHYLAVRCANDEIFNKLINDIREKGEFKNDRIYDNSNLNVIKVWW
ncbi:MAG: hypothetical protein NC548_41105 [Lachnospiraceae bacterium]|nr:hypothetical protein [Lachnospiraceae bacterium]